MRRIAAQALGRDDEIHHVYTTVAHGFAGKFSPATIEHLLAHDGVEALDADCHMGVPDDFETSKQEMPPDVVSKALNAAKAKGVSKMATQSGATWGIDRIDSATGNDNSYNDGGHQGANTVIYILDTGVRIDHVRAAHPRARGKIRATTAP